MHELSDNQTRQAIDAESAFSAWRAAQAELRNGSTRGSMFWKDQNNRRYLIRKSTNGAQTSLGVDSDETRGVYARFMARKNTAVQRERTLRAAVSTHARMNRALRVGQVPPIVVETLNALESSGIGEYFLVIGTHALYAHAAAAHVHLLPEATATLDVDLLFGVRQRLRLAATLDKTNDSFLSVLQRVDPTFKRSDDDLYKAVNNDGFEVDVVRRTASESDPHPLLLSTSEDDLWAVQIDSGSDLIHGQRMEQIVIATNGSMARMRTVAPMVFCEVKRRVAASATRDAGKSRRDLAQAALVEQLVEQYLPQWSTDFLKSSVKKDASAESLEPGQGPGMG